MRTVLWAPRTLLKLRTKRPKERPTSFSSTATIAGKEVKINLPVEDYPTMLFFPNLGPPGILIGRPKEHAEMREMWIYQFNLSSRSLTKYGIESMPSPVLDIQRLSQMLAKIAHSFAVANSKVGSFKPLLLRHIFGTGEFPCHFVGGSGKEPPSTSLHEIGHGIQLVGKKLYMIVDIRLFANLGAPRYSVVVGELPLSFDIP